MKQTLTRILSLLLAIALLLAMPVTPARAAGEVASGTCGENLTWTLDDQGTMTISGTGPMDDYIPDPTPWKGMENDIKTVIVEEGVTTIGADAFQSCHNLAEVQLPDGLTTIGNYAFSWCHILKEVDIPDTVTVVAGGAFSDCYALERADLPAGLQVLGGAAFNYCQSLKSTVIPEAITAIYQATFFNCQSLASVTLPEGLTTIELAAFKTCEALESIKLPSTLTYLDDYAFSQSGLRSLTLPEGLTYLGNGVVSGCTNLESFTYPDWVTEVGGYSFSGCTGLKTVTLPSSLERVGMETFSGCTALETVYFRSTAPAINSDAFMGVTATVYYPANDPTWTKEVKQNYGGQLTWKAYEPSCICKSYKDLNTREWYHQYVEYVLNLGLMNGVGGGKFQPNHNMTRAQLVTVLYRIAGEPSVAGLSNPFTDLKEDWYIPAVIWAANNGVVKGITDTTFAPDQAVTREQAATIMHRYLGNPAPEEDSAAFTDWGKVSDYAREPLLWCIENGFFNGFEDNTLRPQEHLTRAQMAKLLTILAQEF